MPPPEARAARIPSAIMESEPPITFIATALARPILAGNDKAKLPGPRVMTNIWATPAITEKTASANPAVLMPPAPYPRGNTIAANQNKKSPRYGQNHGHTETPFLL